MRKFILLAALLPSPALADGFRDREIAFQALNAIDVAQTCDGVARGLTEANPLFGKHPSCGKVIGIKVVAGIIHYLVADHMNRRNPHDAKVFQTVSLVVQGGVVAANLRFAF